MLNVTSRAGEMKGSSSSSSSYKVGRCHILAEGPCLWKTIGDEGKAVARQ